MLIQQLRRKRNRRTVIWLFYIDGFWGLCFSRYAASHSTGLGGRSFTRADMPSSSRGTTVWSRYALMGRAWRFSFSCAASRSASASWIYFNREFPFSNDRNLQIELLEECDYLSCSCGGAVTDTLRVVPLIHWLK